MSVIWCVGAAVSAGQLPGVFGHNWTYVHGAIMAGGDIEQSEHTVAEAKVQLFRDLSTHVLSTVTQETFQRNSKMWSVSIFIWEAAEDEPFGFHHFL